MRKKTIIALLINCLITQLLIKTITAGIKINEIFPKPSPGLDWVEFYNDSDEPVDLSTYSLSDVAGNKITFSCVLNPKGFLTIDWYDYLNNSGDTIKLTNGEDIIDCISYGNGANSLCEEQFPKRLATPGYNQSLARIKDGDNVWIAASTPTKNEPNDGSIKSFDAVCVKPTLALTQIPPTQTPTPNPTAALTSTPEPTLISHNNIYLSEVMVYPSSNENEWVEIYNSNDFSVSLTNWYIDDVENGGSTPKVFSLQIPPKSYGVFELKSSLFNNSGDSVRLLDFNKSQKDGFEYINPQQGKTYGRISFDSDDFCPQEASKGTNNNNCLNPTPTPSKKPTPSVFPTLTPSLTPTSTKESPTTTFTKISKINISMIPTFGQNTQKTPIIYQKITKGEVLGTGTKGKTLNKPLINSLSFLSFSYSFLTTFSLILKIKRKL